MKRKILILLVLVIVIGGFGFWFMNRNDDSADSAAVGEEVTISNTQETTEEEANIAAAEETGNETSGPSTDEPKQSNPGLPTSDEKPIVNTGSGHSVASAVAADQLTSTVCSATPGSKCKIQFKNTSSGKVIEFKEKEVQNDGNVIWDWKGSDVGTGTWNVYAVSGNLKSDKEVIYIK